MLQAYIISFSTIYNSSAVALCYGELVQDDVSGT